MAVSYVPALSGGFVWDDGYRRGALGLAAAVVVVLGALTWRQSGVYRDEITLFSHVVAHNPDARDAHLNLGNALIEAGRNEDGLAASRIAAEQRPDSADAHSNLALAQMNLERFEASAESLRRALELDPRHKSALQSDRPMAASLHRLMGRAAPELGHPGAAGHYARAVEIDPRDTEAIDRLAMARFQEKRYEEAHVLYRTLAEITPDSAQTHANLGATLYHLGRSQDALRSFERALALDPDLETARAGVRALAPASRASGGNGSP